MNLLESLRIVPRASELAMVLGLAVLGGCDETSEAFETPMARMEHGVAVGDRLSVPECASSPLPDRWTRGGSGQHQLVIVATDSDCAYCEIHLTQMTELVRQLNDPSVVTLLLWAPNAAAANRVLTESELAEHAGVCIVGDEFWRQQQFTHTPFTILLRDDEIIAIADGDIELAGHGARIRTWLARRTQPPSK